MSPKAICRTTAAFLAFTLFALPITAMAQVVPPVIGPSPAPSQGPSGGPPTLPPLISPPSAAQPLSPTRQGPTRTGPTAIRLVPINLRFLQEHPALKTIMREPLSPDRLAYVQHAPIAFKPLTLHDLPSSPTNPNQLILIPVPGGLRVRGLGANAAFDARHGRYRMVRAGTYLTAINQIERSLNQSGYTVRVRPAAATATTIGGKAAYQVEVGHLRFNHALLNRQLRTFRALQHPRVRTLQFRDLKADLNLLQMVSARKLTIEKLPQRLRAPILVHQLHYYPSMRSLATPTPAPLHAKHIPTVNGSITNPNATPTPNPLANLPTYPGTFTWDYPLNNGFGDPNSAQAYINFDFNLNGDISSGASGKASADAGITLFNNPFDIFSATAQFSGTDPSVTSATPQTSKGVDTASINVLVAGQNVYNPTATADWSNSSNPWQETQTFVSITVPIPIMPGLNVAFSASVAGTLGLVYNIGLQGIGVVAAITPSAGLTATFAVALSIDAVVASISAGVEGNLTLLTFSVDLIGAADIIGLQVGPVMPAPASITPPNGMRLQVVPTQLAFQYQYQINDTLTTLSGSADIFTQECLFWDCEKQTLPLFSFSGITLYSGKLAGESWQNVNIGGPFLQQQLISNPVPGNPMN